MCVCTGFLLPRQRPRWQVHVAVAGVQAQLQHQMHAANARLLMLPTDPGRLEVQAAVMMQGVYRAQAAGATAKLEEVGVGVCVCGWVLERGGTNANGGSNDTPLTRYN